MTRDFAPAPPTEREIAAICEEVLGCAPESLTPLRSGAWSSAVSIETIRGPMVIRFSASGDDFRTDQLASRFADPDLSIPRVYAIGSRDQCWWCISDRMPGVHLDELDGAGFSTLLPSLAAVLRAMRDVDSSGTTGYGGWDELGNGRFQRFADQLLEVAVDNPGERGGGWSDRLRQQHHAQAVFDAGMTRLHELVRYVPDVRQLIHQDTINYNVTVANDRISGIFDWGCAMWGDALYDLAWFRFWDPWYPQWSTVSVPDHLELLVGLTGAHAHERMQCYLLHIGLSHIRYNAFTENWSALDDVTSAIEYLLRGADS